MFSSWAVPDFMVKPYRQGSEAELGRSGERQCHRTCHGLVPGSSVDSMDSECIKILFTCRDMSCEHREDNGSLSSSHLLPGQSCILAQGFVGYLVLTLVSGGDAAG